MRVTTEKRERLIRRDIYPVWMGHSDEETPLPGAFGVMRAVGFYPLYSYIGDDLNPTECLSWLMRHPDGRYILVVDRMCGWDSYRSLSPGAALHILQRERAQRARFMRVCHLDTYEE